MRLTHDLELKVNQVRPSSNVESHMWRIQSIFVKFVVLAVAPCNLTNISMTYILNYNMYLKDRGLFCLFANHKVLTIHFFSRKREE